MNRPRTQKKLQILIVDDESQELDLRRRQFEDAGYSVVIAEDGWEGVRKARAVRPDLVLLDVMLPELDGFAVCELLRANSSTAGIPILMVSGLPGQMPRCAAIEAGATDFVTKPVTFEDLVRKVKQVLGHKPARNVRQQSSSPVLQHKTT